MSADAHLGSLIGEVMDLRHAADLIAWDERVYMPDGVVTGDGEVSAPLRRPDHGRFTSPAVGAAIEAAVRQTTGEDPDSDAARRARISARDYDKATRVPADFVAEHATVV